MILSYGQQANPAKLMQQQQQQQLGLKVAARSRHVHGCVLWLSDDKHFS